MAVSYTTINRQDVIKLFHQLMQLEGEMRVLRIVGEAKLGKSHLLTKVFPALARRDYQAQCAILDLRNPSLAAVDILHNACGQLGDEDSLPNYHAAYRDWMNRPQIAVSGLQALLSRVSVSSEAGADDARKVGRLLVSRLKADLSKLTSNICLLLIDAVDLSNGDVQSWLMDTLLVQMTCLEHLRIVIAGRSVPEAGGSYTALCHNMVLGPVVEEDAYIAYCKDVGANLGEQSIRDFARAFDYKPGLFVDFVAPKFMHRSGAYD